MANGRCFFAFFRDLYMSLGVSIRSVVFKINLDFAYKSLRVHVEAKHLT